ncbi:diacylglycerol/lipid kinase family protein [Brevibacterium oceani]|uniref:diacylglycerol/lipid kinase family protein n=1 Tax=Brevibacterium oceani TaxID=358099 RepID=UPI0015E682D5|nr:diacylglycerol kinase family protein [Brevibacterium oceani]
MHNRRSRARTLPAVGIILNPKHLSSHRAYSDLVAAMRPLGIRSRTMTTTRARDGAWQAEELVTWGADVVIILGGDGTIRATGPVFADSETPVLLIPTGTANVVSRHVGITSTRHAITHCLRALSTGLDPTAGRLVPINEVDIRLRDGGRRHTVFLSLAGIGGDARAVAHHHIAPGLLGYVWGAARALFAADLTPNGDGITVDGKSARAGDPADHRTAARRNETGARPGSVWSVMASKVARPAGPVEVFPDARIDAETFSVLGVGPLPHTLLMRIRAWSSIGLSCLSGSPESNAFMDYRKATGVTVRLTTPAPVQLDGELIEDCVELHLSAGERGLLVSAPTP